MKRPLFRIISDDEYNQIESTVNSILGQNPALVAFFSGAGYDLDDVRQEARFIGWKWIARRDLTTDPGA